MEHQQPRNRELAIALRDSSPRGGLARSASSKNSLLIAIHGHPLRVSAELAVRSGADGPAAVALGAALLQCQQLLGTEGLVVDLGSRLDEILQVCPQQKVTQVDEFAVVLILNVDDTPSVLAPTDLLAVHDDALLGADDGEGDETLRDQLARV